MTTHAVEIALLSTLVGFSNFGILLLLCLNSLLACLHLGLFSLNHLCKEQLVFVLKFKLVMHAKKKNAKQSTRRDNTNLSIGPHQHTAHDVSASLSDAYASDRSDPEP